jgi:hypothetical protein
VQGVKETRSALDTDDVGTRLESAIWKVLWNVQNTSRNKQRVVSTPSQDIKQIPVFGLVTEPELTSYIFIKCALHIKCRNACV